MKLCDKCGAELDDDARFCDVCGAKLDGIHVCGESDISSDQLRSDEKDAGVSVTQKQITESNKDSLGWISVILGIFAVLLCYCGGIVGVPGLIIGLFSKRKKLKVCGIILNSIAIAISLFFMIDGLCGEVESETEPASETSVVTTTEATTERTTATTERRTESTTMASTTEAATEETTEDVIDLSEIFGRYAKDTNAMDNNGGTWVTVESSDDDEYLNMIIHIEYNGGDAMNNMNIFEEQARLYVVESNKYHGITENDEDIDVYFSENTLSINVSDRMDALLGYQMSGSYTKENYGE